MVNKNLFEILQNKIERISSQGKFIENLYNSYNFEWKCINIKYINNIFYHTNYKQYFIFCN